MPLWVPFCRRKARLSLYLTLTWPTGLTWDGAGSGTGQTCRNCGCFVGHAHFRQVFPYCSDHIPRIGFGMSDGADIPKPPVGQGLSSHTMNRSNLTRAAIPVRTRLAHCKRHVGRVGIAGMLCHHLFAPFGSDFIQECLLASRLRMPCGVMSESSLWFSPLCSSGVRTISCLHRSTSEYRHRLGFRFLAVQS